MCMCVCVCVCVRCGGKRGRKLLYAVYDEVVERPMTSSGVGVFPGTQVLLCLNITLRIFPPPSATVTQVLFLCILYSTLLYSTLL